MVMSRKKVLVMMKLEQKEVMEVQEMKEEQQKTNL